MEKHRSESFEEMVFKYRNHQYGAYHLRKSYSRHVAVGLFISIILLASAVAYPLITGYLGKTKIPVLPPGEINVTIKKPTPDVLKPIPSPPPEINETKIKFVAPKIVKTDSTDENFGNQDILALNKPTPPPSDETNVQPADNKPEPVIEIPEKSEPRIWVPEMPEFPGGVDEMQHFLLKLLKYPALAKESDIEGIVFIEFVVEKNGMITEITVKRGIGGGCDEEAMRVVKAMPPWKPGKQDGTPVRVRCTLPVKFTLQH